jgi:hypothetical protein
LGHIVNCKGISPDPEKVTAIETYPVPVNLNQLRAFLGRSGYYRRFVKDYSRIASPLYELTKKNVNLISENELASVKSLNGWSYRGNPKIAGDTSAALRLSNEF